MRVKRLLPFFLAACLLAALVAWTPPALAQKERTVSWIGVMLGDGPTEESPGVALNGIVEGGPAAKAGLRARDRIVTVNGNQLNSPRDLVQRIREVDPDSWVSLTYERRGKQRDTQVKLGTFPKNRKDMSIRRGWIGVDAIDLPPALREHFGAPEDSGVMISNIALGSPAEAGGFRLGDVVYEVEGEPVASRAALASLIARGGIDNDLTFTVVRYGADFELEAVLEEAPQFRASGRP